MDERRFFLNGPSDNDKQIDKLEKQIALMQGQLDSLQQKVELQDKIIASHTNQICGAEYGLQ